jgi:predicted Na+-dependent transporter
MKSFFLRRWFLILLLLVLAVGFSWPNSLHQVTAHVPENLVVAAVLFLTALPLDVRVMWQALRRPTAALLAVGISYVFIPLLAWALS